MLLDKYDVKSIAADRICREKWYRVVFVIAAILFGSGFIIINVNPDVGAPIVVMSLLVYTIEVLIGTRKQHKLANILWQEYIKDNAVLQKIREIEEEEAGEGAS